MKLIDQMTQFLWQTLGALGDVCSRQGWEDIYYN